MLVKEVRHRKDRTAAREPVDRTRGGTRRPASSGEIAALLELGDSFMVHGDVMSARLLYQRAADAGDAKAALAVGSTYDPVEYERRGVRTAVSEEEWWRGSRHST